jgi:hypothetical protein
LWSCKLDRARIVEVAAVFRDEADHPQHAWMFGSGGCSDTTNAIPLFACCYARDHQAILGHFRRNMVFVVGTGFPHRAGLHHGSATTLAKKISLELASQTGNCGLHPNN